ncbi:DUF7660 family protein [Archangium primigenium]|uniref:DUF7660 family protein n=1 Tax=[Archangium] primigenium TaxID=2792470 RepID=UPI001955FD97|nr:hypothetical protein [Archangium primigenium]MBM7117747.1 hypothetical protein [Archangium primigenium]
MRPVDPRDVQSREDLARFVRGLAQALEQHPEAWENATLPRFLEAMSAWIEDMDGYYQNQGAAVPTRPEWRTFAEILSAARVYE